MNRAIASLLAVLGLGLLAGPVVQAQTPTPVTSIVNSAQDTTLEVNHNGSLLMPGERIIDGTENDSIPATGAGTRLMWYPAKAAFRAGRVGVASGKEDVWDADSVGTYSVAFGQDTRASGSAATAMGLNTTASGNVSTAMGEETTADGWRATALGYQSTASGNYSTAMGRGTTANNGHATAMGLNTTASGGTATAMGNSTVASGHYSTAMGRNTTASGSDATAMGRQTTASGNNAVAMGSGTLASGGRSTAMGWGTTASAQRSTTMGEGTVAATDQSVSIGECNDANTGDDNTLIVAGNGNFFGTSCDTNSDALVLDKNGDMTIAGTLTESSDRRLKTAIELLDDDVLGALREIDPVRFRFEDERTHPSGEQIGVIAQEVQEVFPELVHEGSGGYLSVAYPKLSAVLLKGVQEQQATIEEQDAEIEALKERVERLEDLSERVMALEARSSGSLPASMSVSGLLVAFLVGGLLGAGLLWRRRA